jgi:hypothetical protein
LVPNLLVFVEYLVPLVHQGQRCFAHKHDADVCSAQTKVKPLKAVILRAGNASATRLPARARGTTHVDRV